VTNATDEADHPTRLATAGVGKHRNVANFSIKMNHPTYQKEIISFLSFHGKIKTKQILLLIYDNFEDRK